MSNQLNKKSGASFNKRSEFAFVEFWRFILIVFVILLHSMAFLYQLNRDEAWVSELTKTDVKVHDIWFGYFCINFSVGGFAIISGYFGKHSPKAVLKMVILIFVYFIFNLLLITTVYTIIYYQFSSYEQKARIIFDHFDDIMTPNWWYILVMLFVYLTSPLLARFVRNTNKWATLMFFLVVMIILFFPKVYGITDPLFAANTFIWRWVSPMFYLFLSFFYCIGIWIKEYYDSDKINNYLYIKFNKFSKKVFKKEKDLSLLWGNRLHKTILIILIIFFYLVATQIKISDDIYVYDRGRQFDTTTSFISVLTFLLIKDIKIKNNFLIKISIFLGKCSIAVYLVHGLVQYFSFKYLKLTPHWETLLAVDITAIALGVIASTPLEWIINKIYKIQLKKDREVKNYATK